MRCKVSRTGPTSKIVSPPDLRRIGRRDSASSPCGLTPRLFHYHPNLVHQENHIGIVNYCLLLIILWNISAYMGSTQVEVWVYIFQGKYKVCKIQSKSVLETRGFCLPFWASIASTFRQPPSTNHGIILKLSHGTGDTSSQISAYIYFLSDK